MQSIKLKGNQLFQLNNSLHWKQLDFDFWPKIWVFFFISCRFTEILKNNFSLQLFLFSRTVIAKWYWPKYGSPCIHSYYFIIRILYAFERFVNNYYHVKKNKWYKLVSSFIVLILAHMGCVFLFLSWRQGGQFNH